MRPEDLKKALDNAAIRHGADGETAAAIKEAAQYIDRWSPAKVIDNGEWSAKTCPRCGMELSTHIGDGVYEDRNWLVYCPDDDCHQRLDWNL